MKLTSRTRFRPDSPLSVSQNKSFEESNNGAVIKKAMRDLGLFLFLFLFLCTFSLFSKSKFTPFTTPYPVQKNQFSNSFENFNIIKTGSAAYIKWSVETHKDYYFFIVLKSRNGIDFQPVCLKHKNMAEKDGSYSFSDSDINTTSLSYKICRIGLDGSMRFSGIKSISGNTLHF